MSLDQSKRILKITGTRIAKIIGLSKYGGPIDVYLDMINEAPPVDELSNSDIDRGKFLEQGVINWYANKTEATIEENSGITVQHPEINYFSATPDAIAKTKDGRRVVIEVKCPRTSQDWGDEGSDQIPEYYLPQVAWELMCCNLDVAHVLLFTEGDLRIYVVPRDLDLERTLVNAATSFWVNHIQPRIPPRDLYNDNYTRFLRQKYETYENDIILQDSGELTDLVSKYFEAKENSEHWQKEMTFFENSIREKIGPTRGAKGEKYVISWLQAKGRTSTSWEKLARSLGATEEHIKKFSKVGDFYRRLIIKKI